MSDYPLSESREAGTSYDAMPEAVLVDVVRVPVVPALPVAQIVRRRFWLPLCLFVGTCLSTLFAGGFDTCLSTWRHQGGFAQALQNGLGVGLMYAVPVMTILLCHEMGHFLQARRYGIYASYPYFIPMPISPLGTFGAVIGMEARVGDRKALFDVGIAGPLAGLVPTLIFCIVGLYWSTVGPIQHGGGFQLGKPLVFQWLIDLIFGPLGANQTVVFHPVAFAGWVGLLITALNLMPIGQLDGGHVLYGLLRRKAHIVSKLLLFGALASLYWFWDDLAGWSLMLFLLLLMGPTHPPTADDNVPLGPWRIGLGWAVLAFIPFGFTPQPFSF